MELAEPEPEVEEYPEEPEQPMYEDVVEQPPKPGETT